MTKKTQHYPEKGVGCHCPKTPKASFRLANPTPLRYALLWWRQWPFNEILQVGNRGREVSDLLQVPKKTCNDAETRIQIYFLTSELSRSPWDHASYHLYKWGHTSKHLFVSLQPPNNDALLPKERFPTLKWPKSFLQAASHTCSCLHLLCRKAVFKFFCFVLFFWKKMHLKTAA